ncbi:transposase zinc-binding domain-containing protein [Streptomyces sp. SS1-1]|uniref:transposase zinc-binding domain-containing protein n=1 Tax=Streptomyces sp. SS1-1 TaxID=2651869 RepID=UPI00178C1FA4
MCPSRAWKARAAARPRWKARSRAGRRLSTCEEADVSDSTTSPNSCSNNFCSGCRRSERARWASIQLSASAAVSLAARF